MSCAKVRHETWTQAAVAMKRQRAKAKVRDNRDGPRSIYHCPECKCYHLTSQKKVRRG